jgi:hypothetical protein
MIKEMIPLLGRNHWDAATPSFRLYKGVANLRAERNKRSILYPLATRVVKGKKIVAKKGTEAVGANDVGLETINLVADGGTTVPAQFLINYPLSYHAGKPATGIISKIGWTECFRSRRPAIACQAALASNSPTAATYSNGFSGAFANRSS